MLSDTNRVINIRELVKFFSLVSVNDVLALCGFLF